MLGLLLSAVLLSSVLLSVSSTDNQNAISNLDVISVVEKATQILASLQKPRMDENSCAYDLAGNDTEAVMKSTE
jgi:hypothetical protein